MAKVAGVIQAWDWCMFITVAVFYCTSVYAKGCQQVCQMGYLIWRKQQVDTAHLPIQLQLINRGKETGYRSQNESIVMPVTIIT